MDRRALLAVGLCLLVLVISELIFPTRPASKQMLGGLDSAAVAESASSTRDTQQTAAAIPRPGVTAGAAAGPSPVVAVMPPVAPETLTVTTPHTVVAFSSVGAAPVAVTMRDYHRTVRNVADGEGSPPVELGRPGEALLRYRIITAHDTLPLDRVSFTGRQSTATGGAPVVTYDASVPGGGAGGGGGGGNGGGTTWHVTITYTFKPNGYLSDITGRVVAAGAGVSAATPAAGAGFLLLDLPSGFPSYEADTADDISQLAYVVKPGRDDPVSTSFSHIDPGQSELRPGPIAWAVAKNKYFLVGVLAADTTRASQFAEVDLFGGVRTNKLATHGAATVVLPLMAAPGGSTFAFELYTGPQEFRRLRAVGRGFENLNPYAGFLHPILQPFVTITVEMVLWLKQVLRINYGWVLVIIGVGTRLLLWPVNQRAMRTSLKMQRLQPELAEVQSKYKNDRDRQQQEMMRVYREHGMSPWSPIAGCLPMFLPWPFFAALYFVFRNTIEFRGVPFLWLHDISVKDPHYILPVLMGASSFLVSWIGMRNSPPNPQTKMMGYMFPVMMTYFFWRIAAGLNLYYLVQSLATLPQQWLLSNERARSAGAGGAGGTSAPAATARPRPGGGSTPSVSAAGGG
jgi:YidC/Oxa1 family membrane protein insertase